MLTIKEIAQIAGVSRGTVDRVINNREGVNPQTAERIRQILDSLNYSPNVAGQSLAARKKSLKFGVILFNGVGFFRSIENGIQRKCQELANYGVTVFLRYIDYNDVNGLLQAMEELKDAGACGIAIPPLADTRIKDQIDQFYESGIQTVTYYCDIAQTKRLAYVGSDNCECGRVIGNVIGLIAPCGVLGIVSGRWTQSIHPERIESCMGKIKQDYPDIRIAADLVSDEDDISAYNTVTKLLAKHSDINLLLFNDLGSKGALRAVQEAALPVRVILHDRISPFRDELKKGEVSVIITQQPWVLGEKPLDILFQYFALGVSPSKDSYLTDIDIKVGENIRYNL